MASDGGDGDRAGEAAVRGRVRDAHLLSAALRLRAQGRAVTVFGAPQAGQEHDASCEHLSSEGMGPSLAVEGATTVSWSSRLTWSGCWLRASKKARWWSWT